MSTNKDTKRGANWQQMSLFEVVVAFDDPRLALSPADAMSLKEATETQFEPGKSEQLGDC